MFCKRFFRFVSSAVLPITVILCFLQIAPASANTIPCTSASSDSDGDGYGFENGRSCLVTANITNVCRSSATDPDGDGFGFEDGRSCRGTAASSAFAECRSSASDPDGNGFGFEDGKSCRVVVADNTSSSTITTECRSSASDPDGDGFGFEDGRSCRVVASSPTQFGANECRFRASDSDGDGFGFENGRTCNITNNSSSDTASTPGVTPGAAPPPVAAANTGFSNGHPICLTDASDARNNGFGFENNRTCFVEPGVTATRYRPLLNHRSCLPWLEIPYGNYKLQNNVWNAGATFSNNWAQCIELTGGPGNYVAKWDYNWLQRNQGQEFAVKSYPQVYYGRKTRFNTSGTVAETGLPAVTDQLPRFRVHYDYSETGIVERNVALESFFHTSCEAEDHNKQYEMMVWVGVPNIRTPGKLVTTATISGQQWDVYTNPALSWAYVAFVAKQPSTRGTLNWNEFVDWSRNVGPSKGVPSMFRFTCMGAIEIGTETFWGSGTFTLNRFQVDRF